MTIFGQNPVYAGGKASSASVSPARGSNVATANSDPARASTSFPISGNLVDQDGSPIRNADLAVYLDPGPAMLAGSASVPGLQIAATQTEQNGQFQLQVPALKNLGSYLDPKGQVTLQFVSFGGRHSMLYQQKVKLPSTVGEPALARVDDKRVFSDRSRTFGMRTQDGRVSPELAGMRLTATTSATDTMSQAGPAAGAQSLEDSECARTWEGHPWAQYWWIREGGPIKTWVPVQRAQTGKKTTMKYEWSSSTESSTEVAVNYEYKVVAAGGGYTDLTEAGNGVPFSVGQNVIRDLEAEYDYYSFRLWCGLSGDATQKRDAKVTKALPVSFTGGSRNSSYSGYYTCTNNNFKTEINNPLWVSKASTTTLQTSTSIYGISLSTKQVNTSLHKKTYTPVTGPAYLCGEDGNPVDTEKVGEVNADSSVGFAKPNSSLNSLFNNYGNSASCSDWSGADATQSVSLPSGKRAWFFADSFLNSPTARVNGFNRSTLRNSIVIQNGSSMRTITGGNTCRENDSSLSFWDRFAKTPFSEPTGSAYYWPGDAMVVGNNVVKFFYRNVPQGGWWTDTHSAVAAIPISSLESSSVINMQPTLLPPVYSYGQHPINWGLALLPQGSEVYIYGAGIVNAQNSRRLYVAKATPNDLTNPSRWTFWTGSTWSAVGNQSAARAVSPDLKVENGFSVAQVKGSYWLVQHEPGLDGGDIIAHPAATPYGFGASRISLYTPPEGPRDAAHKYQFYYEARVHAGLGASDKVVVSYNVNTSAVSVGCRSRNNHDAGIYRPRFLDVPVDMFQPGSATVPSTAGSSDSGSYQRGIRDHSLEAQGNELSKPAAAVTPASAVAMAADYGWYDGWAPPQEGNGGCPPLNQATNLTGVAGPDGRVTLNWTDYGRDMWYWVYSRDATANEPFTRRELWTTGPSVVAAPVMVPERQGHHFEWYVVPWASGNEAEASRSNILGLTVNIQPPAKVAGVTATNIANGAIQISWNSVSYPSPNVYYYVDYWNVLEQSEAQAVRIGPFTGPTTLKTVLLFDAGDTIAFRVRAKNIGGLGQPSDVVTRTAT
ncbi:hypothetical protein HNR22_001799 [Micromonospora jinlongensis]|uniref:Fibronectin type-III domain-containing protein n=1 Tax=Micromonospora jinlongensis TaxID=1287877 RepID=A0A7Z0BE70_9ACTN|nr:hypothetical protein [Micromonospora jinlongensis]NYH42072.1 hypothetical protein [Micromonospora jinlongensis]